MNQLQRPQTALNYPESWKPSSIDTYERLHTMGKITQSDVDEIETRLQWFRDWRDYFVTTGGVDETVNGYRKAAGE
jgi:hypothetical protein